MTRVKRLPFGLKINFEKNGLFGASFVLLSWIYAHVIVYQCIALPMFKEGLLPYPVMICYIWIGACTLISFFRSMFSDPGRILDVPTSKVIDWSYWEKCPKCVKPRPPRSHHCSKCGHCVLKMDHHCMWINNCVGAGNHWIFLTLLCYAIVCACVNSFMYFRYISTWKKICLSCNKSDWLDLTSPTTTCAAYLLSFALIIGPSLLLITNYVNVLNDRTSLENMTESSFFVAAAMANSGTKSNKFFKMLSNVCGSSKLIWILPFRRRPFPLTNFSGLELSDELDV